MPDVCYICGATGPLIDGECIDCYKQDHPLANIPQSIELKICRDCFSYWHHGKWIVPTTSSYTVHLENAIQRILKNKYVKSKSISITVKIMDYDDKHASAEIILYGTNHSKVPPYVEKHNLTIKIHQSLCRSCSLRHGGHHESILQIRAQDRKLSTKEEEEITAIIHNMLNDAYGHDSKAYISEITHERFGGLTLDVGSEHLCKSIATEIRDVFLGTIKESFKLVGVDPKNGERRYLRTIVVRLPRFKQGDFIEVDNIPSMVVRYERKRLICLNLIEHNTFSISIDSNRFQKIVFLKDANDIRTMMILSITPNTVQLMDNTSYEVIDVDKKQIPMPINTGETVHSVNLKGRLFFIKSEEHEFNS